jgi:hypothetical protein
MVNEKEMDGVHLHCITVTSFFVAVGILRRKLHFFSFMRI